MNRHRHRQWLFTCALFGISGVAACGQGPTGSAPQESETAPASTVDKATASAIHSQYDVAHAGWINAPGGKLVHPSCVHQVPSGAEVDTRGNVRVGGLLVAHYEECGYAPVVVIDPSGMSHAPPGTGGDGGLHPLVTGSSTEGTAVPSYTGWALASWATSSTYFTFMGTDEGNGGWTVPSAPTNYDGQTIYIFDSLESSDNGEIIVQPVLQWSGGPWQIASWAGWGTNSLNYFESTPVNVAVNDSIQGAMFISSVSGTNDVQQRWSISTYDVTTNKTTSEFFTASDPNGYERMIYAQGGVLELWYVSGCSDLPATGATIFQPPTIYQASNTAGTSWETYSDFLPSWNNQNYVGANPFGSGCTFSISTTTVSSDYTWTHGTTLEY